MRPVAQGSIHLRLLLAASLVLTAFLGLTGLSLDGAFRSASEEALKARLQSSIYALLAAAEEDEAGRLTLPPALPDPRLNLPDSGLYAEVVAPQVGFYWRSASTLGRPPDFLQTIGPGQSRFQYKSSSWGDELFALSFGVVWEDYAGQEIPYVLAVAENLQAHQEQIEAFRDTLFLWLGGVALVLLLAQGWVLRWGLQPLRIVANELQAVESGQSDQLSGDYPRELKGLARSINSLIRHAQARQQRYRDSLGDLAHSLKTPLAILQNLGEHQPIENTQQQTLTEQVARMNQIVGHQLQRAAASGRITLATHLLVKPVAERIARTLSKVYREKEMVWELALDEATGFQGDEGDLMEMLGNLMDNAWKYGRKRVKISARSYPRRLELHIEDDGSGIPPDRSDEVLQRGQRMDEQQPGQGIGLAVAKDIIHAYGGELRIGRSTLGGADVALVFSANGGS